MSPMKVLSECCWFLAAIAAVVGVLLLYPGARKQDFGPAMGLFLMAWRLAILAALLRIIDLLKARH